MADLAARVCVCGHSGHWHAGVVFGPNDERKIVEMGAGGCDNCECKRFEEDHTDTYESLRAELRAARTATSTSCAPANRSGSTEKIAAEFAKREDGREQ